MTNLTSDLSSPVRVDGERLWQRLMAMAAIGATAKGGCNLRIDRMGNIFARRQGVNSALAAVITGSHLDTQPTGGKFDGVYGVLAGLEVIETLNELNIVTQHPLEVVVWTNEEGARFSPAMVGSGVWAGAFSEAYGHSAVAKSGVTIGEELARIGFLGDVEAKAFPVHAAFELHIEQGPILEQQAQQIGVVSGVQGIRWYDLTLTGQTCHAGPTPMPSRRDPFMALAPQCIHAVQTAVNQLGYSHMGLVSGAGHDAVYVSRVAPTSMIFIPCAGGISHNEAEDVDPKDVTAGANVLLHAMLQQAQVETQTGCNNNYQQ